MGNLPAALLRSITWDQGTEMARHLTIAHSLGVPVYFCDSRSPWQRGSNENANGLLQDYFPQGTDLSTRSTQHLLAVENELMSLIGSRHDPEPEWGPSYGNERDVEPCESPDWVHGSERSGSETEPEADAEFRADLRAAFHGVETAPTIDSLPI
jgi:hypothetical protein